MCPEALLVLVAGVIEFPKALLQSANIYSKAYAALTALALASAAIVIYAPFPSVRSHLRQYNTSQRVDRVV
eukprot:7682051-Pyramimonas_sp.AAC.1